MTVAKKNTLKTTFNYSFSEKIYWLNQLSKELPETKLITDYLRPAIAQVENKSINFEFSKDLSTTILNVSQKSFLSVYLILVSAFNILLHKYTDNNELIIGSPVYQWESNNNLVNQIIPLRFSIKDTWTFKDFLLQVKEATIQAYGNQNYPINKIVELLNQNNTQNVSSLFDIVVLLENIHDTQNLTDINRDLIVSFIVEKNQIKGSIHYNSSLFRPETIANLWEKYVDLVEVLIKNVNRKISEISWITEEEQHRLLNEFNDNSKFYPVTLTLEKLFEKQVAQTPNNIAVVHRHERVTYQEINKKANQLARYLLHLGVQQGDFLAILKQRDIDFLIAILAILKTGAIYVPIDSTYPAERIRYMLANSEVKIVLTDSFSLESLTSLVEDSPHLQHAICLDIKPDQTKHSSLDHLKIGDQVDFLEFPAENLAISNKGTDPAYMIYTSGSTGLPKGAIIRHGGAINHIYAQFDALELTEDFTFLQSAPASSDISVWQFLAPILIGGRTVIIDSETVCDPEKLFKLIKEEEITTVELVPIVLRSLLDYILYLSTPERLLPHLKQMMVTGESVSVDLVNQWLHFYPFIKLVNAYGPTEAADDITQLIIHNPLPDNQRTVPIGKPLANLNLYILDQKMQLVPIGVPGEICVSGYGVGLGYWQNEENTKSSFIPNPFAPNVKPLPGTDTDFIYKTGDLGRWLPDGNIEFLGRIDHQVKIRGFRIELGEIETLLGQHPSVRETVVVIREDLSNHKRLVAYLVPRHQDSFLVPQLRNLLKQSLPEHMIPSSFVLLEAFPQTPSGKVDRKALPAPEPETANKLNMFVAPSTSVEETLAKIWAPILGVDRVGIHDNFFELGGDSILCLQVIAKAHQEQLHITPKQVFQHQTIAELAPVVGTTQNILAEQGLVTGDVPLTPIQHYFFAQNLQQPHYWNEAVLLEIKQILAPKLLEQVVEQLLLHHDALRLQFEQKDSGWQQINTISTEIIPFSYFDLSPLPAEEQQSALEAKATQLQASFNLSQGSLVRVALFNLGASKTSRLLIIIHHIVVDSLSWRILIEDLQTAYEQINRGERIKLPAKTTSFQQWSQKLDDYANSPSLKQELDYWLAASRKQICTIPVDYLGGANTEALARTISVTLNQTETQVLLQEVPAVYRTHINDVLLTGLVYAFAGWTQKKSLLVNLESHGREEMFDEVNLSRTVGLFSTIFPIYLELGESSHPGEALKIIKEQLRKIPHGGIGYGLLRYLSKDPEIKESLQLLPQAEVVFNYLGQFDQTLSNSSMFNLVSESVGPQSSPKNNRSHLLSFNSFVIGGQLQLNCTYSEAVYRPTTVENLTQGFLAALRSLIVHCQSDEAGGFTPSDFPLVELNQDELDEALGMVEF